MSTEEEVTAGLVGVRDRAALLSRRRSVSVEERAIGSNGRAEAIDVNLEAETAVANKEVAQMGAADFKSVVDTPFVASSKA